MPPEPSVQPSGSEPNGSGVQDADEKKKKEKPVPLGKYAVGLLTDLLNEARAAGKTPPPLTGRQRGEYGEFYKQADADGETDETCSLALRWLVAKASGDVPDEKKAWAYFGTALDAVREGWRPAGMAGMGDAERERVERENEENAAMLRELLEAS